MATLPSGRLAQSPGILDPDPTVTSAEGLHCVSLQPPKPKVTDSEFCLGHHLSPRAPPFGLCSNSLQREHTSG